MVLVWLFELLKWVECMLCVRTVRVRVSFYPAGKRIIWLTIDFGSVNFDAYIFLWVISTTWDTVRITHKEGILMAVSTKENGIKI